MSTIGVGIIGCGQIALANHVPGFALCPDTRIVALCDSAPAVLERAARQTGIAAAYSDVGALLKRDDLHAIVIATPNVTHAPIALAAIAAGKHVLCEKPIAMDLEQAMAMYRAAQAAGVRHMTAFTYRFVPAMRYMAKLVRDGAIGRPVHFRAQRFQDWGDRALGWRQVREQAGSGELGDMLSHRLDYGYWLVGAIARLVANTTTFHATRGGARSDVDDWVAVLADFAPGATGVWESTKLASGHGEGALSHDWCEVNGEEGTLVYRLREPHRLLRGRKGAAGLALVDVPDAMLKVVGSPRDPQQGDPLITFRYDQDFEFTDAIRGQRDCSPSLCDGVQVQAAMDAIVQSARQRRWVDVPTVS